METERTQTSQDEPRQRGYFDGQHWYKCCWSNDPCIYHRAESNPKDPAKHLREIEKRKREVVERGERL
jgi:hypothetical protein